MIPIELTGLRVAVDLLKRLHAKNKQCPLLSLAALLPAILNHDFKGES